MPGMSGTRGATPDVNTVLGEHSREVPDRLVELLFAGNPSGHIELAADDVACLEQRYVVAAFSSGHRCGQACGARADDGDAAGAAGRREHQVGLPPGPRVEQ